MRRNSIVFIFIFIFSICLLCSFSFAECQHEFEIVEENTLGKHYRICRLCKYEENSSKHIVNNSWSFDDDGKYHFYNCNVSGCGYEYKKSEHIGGTHENNGVCSVCNGIYQTHELDAVNIGVDEASHWYMCSYDGCNYSYEKEPHEETEFITGDLTYHWYRCKLIDCTYKFDKEKHYGGNSNNGYCEFDLCERLYMAKLQIDEYQYREYNVGDKDTLVASIIPLGIKVPKAEYKWYSSMPEVVIVDEKGNIETLREGIAIIYAEYGKYKASCIVVVGELEFSVSPTNHTLHVNEIGTSSIDVIYKENNKKININKYVDFNAFKWSKTSLKSDIKNVNANNIEFLGKNVTQETVLFYIWLDNRLKLIDDEISKVIGEDEKYVGKGLIKLKEKFESIEKSISEESSILKIKEIKKKLKKINSLIKENDKYEDEEIIEIEFELLSLRESCRLFCEEVSVDVVLDSKEEVLDPSQEINKPNDKTENELDKGGNDSKDENSSQKDPEKNNEHNTTPVISGPGHKPEAPVANSSNGNMVNRKHVCSTQSYFPNPDNAEKGHIKRCYYQDCEFYKKGIAGTESSHSYKYNVDRKVNVCIICYYEEGSGVTEPQIVHSRDFGIDVLQSQYLIVKDIKTEVDLNITGVEKDLKIYYGPKDGVLKSTTGRDDENSIYVKWDVKDSYAQEAFDINLEKNDEKSVITVELKEGYIQPTRTEVDLILENNFGEKRIETIELIKEAPERAQFILRFSSDIISSIKVGETKEINVICKSQYGYAEGDRKEVQDYYKSKNLINYEDIELKWEGLGGITATGATTPDSNGYAKGQITGVSVTDNKNPAELIITATAKYENEDLIDEIERELKRGIIVYEVQENLGSNSSQISSTSGGGNSSESNGSGSALPIAAGVIGALALCAVFFIVNHTTKG